VPEETEPRASVVMSRARTWRLVGFGFRGPFLLDEAVKWQTGGRSDNGYGEETDAMLSRYASRPYPLFSYSFFYFFFFKKKNLDKVLFKLGLENFL
jgi:hypothetical protein